MIESGAVEKGDQLRDGTSFLSQMSRGMVDEGWEKSRRVLVVKTWRESFLLTKLTSRFRHGKKNKDRSNSKDSFFPF